MQFRYLVIHSQMQCPGKDGTKLSKDKFLKNFSLIIIAEKKNKKNLNNLHSNFQKITLTTTRPGNGFLTL